MKKITTKTLTVLGMASMLLFASSTLFAGSWNLNGESTYLWGRIITSLSWSPAGCSSANVDVFRDGNKIATTANDGNWGTDYTGPSSGSANYWICEAGSTTWYDSNYCSNVKTLSW